MATLESVKTKINGLISDANSTTGKSDTTLTSAVTSLKAGYSQGSGGFTWKDILSGSYIRDNTSQSILKVSFCNNIHDGAFAYLQKMSVTNFTMEDPSPEDRNKNVNIGAYAFANCGKGLSINKGLLHVTIPNIENIGERAFNECDMLMNVNLSSYVQNINDGAFFKCSNLNDIGTLDLNCSYIGGAAFAWCSRLNISTVNAYYIGARAFYGTAINEITLCSGYYDSSGDASIEDYSFADCTSLQSVTINGWYALRGNLFDGTPLTEITLGSTNEPLELSSSLGGSISTVKVPMSMVEQYRQATNWSQYNIEGYY